MWTPDLDPTNDCPKGKRDIIKEGYLGPENCIFYYDGPIIWTEQDDRFLIVWLNETVCDWDRELRIYHLAYEKYYAALSPGQWLYLVVELKDEDRENINKPGSDDKMATNRVLREAKGLWIVLENDDDGTRKSWHVQYDDLHKSFLPYVQND